MILQDGKAVLELPADADAFPRLTGWLEGILDETGFPVRASKQIMICTDEVAANIVSYAYPEGGGKFSVSVRFDPAQKELELVFADYGIAFDPLQHEAPDTTAPLEKRKAGGLGILVVLRMMDRVEYRRDGDRNVLTLVKRGNPA